MGSFVMSRSWKRLSSSSDAVLVSRRAVKRIPRSLVFDACALLVSHFGSGLMTAALEHGLPMVNIPIATDQPENAERCARGGRFGGAGRTEARGDSGGGAPVAGRPAISSAPNGCG